MNHVIVTVRRARGKGLRSKAAKVRKHTLAGENATRKKARRAAQ